MSREGATTRFMTGFLQGGVRTGRPVAILVNDTASFFVSDDLNGAIYWLRYQPVP